MFTGILQKFPDTYTPNQQQVKLLKNIEQAFDDGYKFVVCSAPTGSGKSFISKTLSNFSNTPTKEFISLVDSYQAYKKNSSGGYDKDIIDNSNSFGLFALTITKALQDQYKELFDDVSILKGKSNYRCEIDTDYTVEYAPCVHINKLKDSCWNNKTCPYYEARNRAITSTFTTLNYNMFFALPEHLKKRQFIVCDEASELEDQLVKEFTCNVSFEYLNKCGVVIPVFPGGSDYGKSGRWVSMCCLM